jgi:transcriptional regulator with XRE-family HTH domain
MAAVTGSLTPEALGELLRNARENAKLTQAAAAQALNVARTTLVAIEQGQRRARVEELQKLAALYRVSLNVLLRQDGVRVDLRPRFRKAGEDDQEVEGAVALLNSLVQAELELENLLGIKRARNDPPERPLLPGNVILQAEQDAAELRQWLGLGMAPIHDMLSLLEVQLGARVFVRQLPARVSGLYAFDEEAGACILLNAAHPRDRRAQTGAHETGHFISTRRAPDALYSDSPETTREER